MKNFGLLLCLGVAIYSGSASAQSQPARAATAARPGQTPQSQQAKPAPQPPTLTRSIEERAKAFIIPSLSVMRDTVSAYTPTFSNTPRVSTPPANAPRSIMRTPPPPVASTPAEKPSFLSRLNPRNWRIIPQATPPAPTPTPAVTNLGVSPVPPSAPERPIPNTIKEDKRIGHVYLLNEDKKFYKFNEAAGENEEIMVPRGTRIRLDSIIETEASKSRKSYWNFTVVDTVISLYAQPLGAEIWVIRKKIPKNLVRVGTQPPMPRQPVIDPALANSPLIATPELDVNDLAEGAPSLPKVQSTVDVAAEERIDANAVFPIVPGKLFAPSCTNFLDERGTPGVWGRNIMQVLDTPKFSSLLDEKQVPDLVQLCPAYATFKDDIESKKKFWVYFIATMASGESQCKTRSVARGPYGGLAGIMQLNSAGHKECPGLVNFNPFSSIRCTLIKLKNQVVSYGALMVRAGKTNFAVLRTDLPDHQKTMRRLAVARACRVTTDAASRRR